MKGTSIVCPHCKRALSVPQSAFGQSLPCPLCGWSIAIPHPHVPPPSDALLDEQDDILADYHDRLVELYETTTSLIDAVRAKSATAQAKIDHVLNAERRRVAYLLEDAELRMTAIVDAAETAAPRMKFETRFPNKIRCPHCRKTVRYKDRGAGRSVRCPNASCGQPIFIPSHGERFWLAIHLTDQGEPHERRKG
jgi:ssDNA-binding Zn-finger/Zn-ribbon topoisomerase 1